MQAVLSRSFHSNSGYGDSVSEERAAANLATAAQQGPTWRCNNVLVPMQDAHNHDSFSSPTYSYDEDRDRFVLRAERQYAEGQQVTINYGQVSNDILLQCYGFVEQDNPADTFCLPHLSTWLQYQEATHTRCADAAARLDRLKNLNLLSHLHDAHLTMTTVDCVARETLQALRAYLASDSDLAHIRTQTAADFRQPLNPENEMSVFQTLLEHVIHTQEAMPGSMQADCQLLGEGGHGGGGDEGGECKMCDEDRTAVLFRREKRKVLASARDRLEHNTEMKWL